MHLKLKFINISKNIGIFFETILNKEIYRFNYGKGIKNNSYLDILIKLPIQLNSKNEPIIDETKKYSKNGYLPDFQFMENYVQNLDKKYLMSLKEIKKPKEVNPKYHFSDQKWEEFKTTWKEFKIGNIFLIIRGQEKKIVTKLKKGSTKYISSTETNNGVVGYYDCLPKYNGKYLSIALNGSVLSSFFQSKKFTANGDVGLIKIKENKFNINEYNAFFQRPNISYE